MTKNKVVEFPASINSRIQALITWRERQISKYEKDVKKLNWFAFGFLTGIFITFSIACCVIYFVGCK